MKNIKAFSDDCSFAVYTIPPKKDFEEVGAIEFSNNPSFIYPCNIEDAIKAAKKHVCGNGNGLLCGRQTV